jgi:hypothetical protein
MSLDQRMAVRLILNGIWKSKMEIPVNAPFRNLVESQAGGCAPEMQPQSGVHFAYPLTERGKGRRSNERITMSILVVRFMQRRD